VPAAIRKILKKTKLHEIVVVNCKQANHPKLIDHLPDPNNIFMAEWLGQANVRITFTLLEWSQKDYIFKIPVAQKIQRVTFLKDVSAKCFKAGKFDKACKIYKSIKKFFDSKDVRNNFCKEDEQTTDYRDSMEELEQMSTTNLTNLAVVMLKQSNYS